ncbi:MAG: sigma-54 dependent transcriptional regulator [Candidatus Marinimicrobia bacterium]|nr:sigma-54 dependent transcriptional regulator [Candidatus Neomarinimicrobiota bacterium]MCF7880574.1 sigma-54 dependent transcriptional regulator [Candidatus Neomarinimicrobiota bacterium]
MNQSARQHKRNKVLVVDDDASITEIIEEHLSDLGYRVFTAADAPSARDKFSEHAIDVALLDINLKKDSGLDLLRDFKSERPEIVVIMISAISDIKTVVKSIQQGAYDYLVKPIIDLNQVNLRIEKAFSEQELKSENLALKNELSRQKDIPEMQSRSPAMAKVKDMIKTVAQYDSTVLITGESGTGKEVAARNVHKHSDRAEKPFIAVNCGGIPSSLLESTLFGYEKGAFTGANKRTRGLFEESNNGTIFLDEVTETDADFQVKLLRVLEDSTIRRVGGTEEITLDLRVIAATNKDLKQYVDDGKFREDLYYRLHVVNISLPPLRQRTEDIPLIVDYQVDRLAEKLGRENLTIEPEVMEKFQEYNWPGNIRELINILESAIIMSNSEAITYSDLPSHFKTELQSQSFTPIDGNDYQSAKTEFERVYFTSLLSTADNNITKAAEIAGITRQHLYHKMKELDIKKN